MHALLPGRRANGRRRLAASGAMALAAALAVGGLAPVAAADPIATTTTLEASAATLQEHHPLTLTATVAAIAAPEPAPPIVGTVTLKDVYNGGDGTNYGPVDVVGGQATFQFSTLLVGTHVFTAEFTNGDGAYEDSKSVEVVVEVTPDVVEASGVGVGLATFYPKVDGYKDTLPVKGTRGEPLTVAITIRNSANKIVRTASLAKAVGAYTWSWNGKNKAGTLQPAGKYTVVQTLRDGFMTKVVKSTVALSWKKLDWRSFTTTKTLRQAAEGGPGWAGWNFTVPAATVYGKLTVGAYAKGYGAVGARKVACGGTAWDLNCFYGREFSGGWAWYSTSMPGKSFVSSAERVRVVVLNLGGKFGFEKVKVTIKYAVLR
jgi:hypothetical protein